jgi:carboxyl-terminal processing protease
MLKKRTVAGFLVGVFVGLTVATLATVSAGATDDYQDELIRQFFKPVVWLVTQIEHRYVTTVDLNDLAIGAYDGILSRLDKYSAYIPADRKEEFESDTKGEFGGLGVTIRYLPVKKAVLIDQAIPGTPAFDAGILPGDMIVEALEEATGKKYETSEFKDVHDAVRILRGEPGSKVTLTVVHEKGNVVQDITITRAIIRVPGVRAVHMIDPAIGYLYVPYFHEQTVSDLKLAIDDLRSQGAKGIIIDLRFDPGGLLKAAEQFADLFLDGSVIVSTKGLHESEQVIHAHSGQDYPDLSVVVLVNRFSASASEIVAAALGENGRATVVGEPTYGKASVQTLMDDPNTGGAVKLTTAHYFTPLNNMIEGKGVQPSPGDTIKLSDEDLLRLRTELSKLTAYPPPLPGQAQEAAEEGGPQPATPENAQPAAPAEGQAGSTPETKAAAKPEKPFDDVQLDRAVQVLTQELAARTAPAAAGQDAASAQPMPAHPAAAPQG